MKEPMKLIQPAFNLYFSARAGITPPNTDISYEVHTPAHMRIFDFSQLTAEKSPLTIMPCAFCIWLIAYNSEQDTDAHFFCIGSSNEPVAISLAAYDSCFAVLFDDTAVYFNRHVRTKTTPAALHNEIIEYTPKNDSYEYSLVQQFKMHPNTLQHIDAFISFLNASKAAYVFPKETLHIRELIKDTQGSISVEQLSLQTGYSTRHINRLFTAQFGFGPKDYCKYVRFQKALSEILADASRQNSEFIQNIGYSDQAHFQREFKHFMGETPRQFIARLR